MRKRDKTADSDRGRERQPAGIEGLGLGADLARLPREIAPSHDLWPAIAGRLAARSAEPAGHPRGGWRTWLAAAALLLAGVGIGFVLDGEQGSVRSASRGSVVQAGNSAEMMVGETVGATATRGSDALTTYRIATAELRSDLAARAGYLDPQTRELVQRDLALIEAAIAEIERAVADAPADPTLERLLLTRYRQQVDLLTRWLPTGSVTEEYVTDGV